jgi:TolB-like protein
LLFHFENFVLDTERRELSRAGDIVNLEPQVFDLLEYLVRNRDRLVSRDDLLNAVWNGRIVSESALTSRINAARTAVADRGDAQRLIRTVRGRGLRFVGEVQTATSASAEPMATSYALPDRPSIAVLPFENLSGDPGQEHLADGITEDIITALSHIRWLFVIARGSTFTYKGKGVDVVRIARELGVRYVLEGSIRRQQDRVRITVQLVQADSATQLWAHRYDRAISDFFALQDEITDAVAGSLENEIAASERDRARRKPPDSLAAWDLFQRGWWHYLQQNGEHFAEARRLFRSAGEREPTFAAPYAALALVDYEVIARMWTNDPDVLTSEMLEAGSRAVALDSNDSFSHVAMGLAFLQRRDQQRAIGEHNAALALNPSSAMAHWSYGVVLNRCDCFEQAIEHFDAAMRLSPRDPKTWQLFTFKASALYHLRRYEETVACAREATRHPTSDLIWPFVHLAGACAHLGQLDEAAFAIRELQRRKPGLTLSSLRAWPNNQLKSAATLAHILDGLRKAGLPG